VLLPENWQEESC